VREAAVLKNPNSWKMINSQVYKEQRGHEDGSEGSQPE
jgi:hypothetical protein